MVTKTDQLTSGTYYILDSARRVYVGRSLQEDISILPKPIVSVPLSEGCSPPKWVVERRPDGTYTLRIANAPVEAVRGALYAFLHPNDVPDEWVILPARGDLYTIENRERQAAWTVPERVGPHSQVVTMAALNARSSRPTPDRLFSFIAVR